MVRSVEFGQNLSVELPPFGSHVKERSLRPRAVFFFWQLGLRPQVAASLSSSL